MKEETPPVLDTLYLSLLTRIQDQRFISAEMCGVSGGRVSDMHVPGDAALSINMDTFSRGSRRRQHLAQVSQTGEH